MRRGERARFARLVEETVRPGGVLPPVASTDAVEAFESWLRAAPLVNRAVLRVLLLLRRRVAAADDVVRRLAAHCYYGDPAVMRALGYDADEVVRRAREVHA